MTGGGIEFVRVFSQKRYGIPPEQVIGSSMKTAFEMRDGQSVLMRLPQRNVVTTRPGNAWAFSSTSVVGP